jgi:glycosyltransferase involved in cell wall biosynthesis
LESRDPAGHQPAVSVVIPAFHHPELLERALASVRAQTTDDWEAIVVDDASTEPLECVVADLGDPRIRYVRREQNGGVAVTQNTGLGFATGRAVAFLHEDDEYLPDRLTRLCKVLDDAPPDVGGVESGHEERDQAGRRTEHPPYLDGAGAADVLAYRAGVHISKLLLRREVADAIRFDEALRGAEDRDFTIRLLRRWRVVVEPTPLVRIERSLPGLRAQAKGPIYEYLFQKYRDEIVADGELHASWQLRIARAYAHSREIPPARRAVRRAIRADPRKARIWPLGAASLLGNQVFSVTLRTYQRLAGGAYY